MMVAVPVSVAVTVTVAPGVVTVYVDQFTVVVVKAVVVPVEGRKVEPLVTLPQLR
jgi:hypothetical protein